jgi:GDP/UDP-N,N'-diacetylbacillosamine 2-epimerase (hydrolysing)
LQVLAHIVDTRRPNWLLAPADREESITLALCGAYMGLAIAHYGAGDRVVGNVDDMIRHAVSRLSHLLLTTHEDARKRLIDAGEQEWRVHNVGHAGLDRIAGTAAMTDDELADALGVAQIKKPYLVVIQHPLSSEFEAAGRQMRETLAAAKELEMQTFVSYPNSDAGGRLIIDVIEQYRSQPKFHVFQNIPDAPFINLLRGAAVLLGNSSLGLLEAPSLRLPVVNIGARQKERHHVENVVFVAGDKEQIVDKVRSIVSSEEIRAGIANCSNPYGDGHTGERVANLLATIPIDAKLLNKDLSY